MVSSLSVMTSVTVGKASSSAIVSVTFDGLVIPWLFDALPEMVTDLLGESTSLLLAVMVTVPELVVTPAAKVSVLPLCVKSATAALDPAVAVTVTVVTALEERFSVAVTVVEPAFSEMVSSASVITSVTTGGPSSSVMVPVPVMEVAPPANEPLMALFNVTITVSLPSSWVSLVTVISKLSVVSPAEKVSVPLLNAV